MKSETCYSCGSRDHAFYAEENGFTLVKCNRCGLLFIENPPDPEQIAAATKEGRHKGGRELEVTGRFNRAALSRYAVVLNDLFATDLASKKSWLDVGCGHGEFVRAIQDVSRGAIAVTGMEPNVHKVRSARRRGLNVASIDLSSHEERL